MEKNIDITNTGLADQAINKSIARSEAASKRTKYFTYAVAAIGVVSIVAAVVAIVKGGSNPVEEVDLNETTDTAQDVVEALLG